MKKSSAKTFAEQDRNNAAIAFILSKFPCVDETFILREMSVLAQAGFEFDIYSIKKSRDKIIQPQAQALLPRLFHRPFFFSWEIWRAQYRFVTRRTKRYFGTLLQVCRESRRHPKTLLKNLILFPQAVCYADRMQRRRVALVHAFWATFPGTMAWIIHRLTGLRYSFSAHAHDIYEDDTMLVSKLDACAFVMTCTAYNQAHLSRLARAKTKDIKLVYHGHHLTAMQQDAKNKDAPNGFFRILSIGTFYHTKGFDTLIEACAVLKQKKLAFQCKIVGDGPEKLRLQNLIRERGLEQHVFLLGYLPHEQLRPLRRWADAFILLPRPYLHWGIPNVYIEALACQVAVIATPLNAIRELIEPEHTGLLVEADDPDAAAAALMRLHQNPELRRQLALAGQQRAQQLFDDTRTTKQVIDLFTEKLLTPGVRQPQ